LTGVGFQVGIAMLSDMFGIAVNFQLLTGSAVANRL